VSDESADLGNGSVVALMVMGCVCQLLRHF
jgi:hypothetical protein